MSTAVAPALTLPLPTAVAGSSARPVLGSWRRLARDREPMLCFDPVLAAGLPEPARRWLTHAVAPGTPIPQAVILEMEGRTRLLRWMPFRAVQVEVPAEGYVWAARAKVGPLSITGFDRYADGAGEMRWRLPGGFPVLTASGADITRSAAGRLALDAVLVPTSFLSPAIAWREDPARPDTAFAVWRAGSEPRELELQVGGDGALLSVSILRWANPGGAGWGRYSCGGALEQEATFGGITIPTVMRVGYFFGSDRWSEGEFFRARITAATYR